MPIPSPDDVAAVIARLDHWLDTHPGDAKRAQAVALREALRDSEADPDVAFASALAFLPSPTMDEAFHGRTGSQ